MSQRLLVGVSSVIFGLACGCSHEKSNANQPVASAGVGAGGEVSGEGAGAQAGAQGQVGPAQAGAGVSAGAGENGAYGNVSGGASVGGNDNGGYAQGSAYGGSYSSTQNGNGLACPMEIPGSRVTVGEINGGIALDFTTTGDVTELRSRVRALAAGPSDTSMTKSAGGDQQGSGGREMHHDVTAQTTRTQVKDLPNGARIIFIPSDPGQFDSLRAEAQQQAQRLNQGDCSGLAVNGLNLGGNIEHKANRTPPQGPNDPTPAPNQNNPNQP